MTVAVVINVAGGLGRFCAKCHGIRWLSVLWFGRLFSGLLVLDILLRNRAAASHTIYHWVFPPLKHIGSPAELLAGIFEIQ